MKIKKNKKIEKIKIKERKKKWEKNENLNHKLY